MAVTDAELEYLIKLVDGTVYTPTDIAAIVVKDGSLSRIFLTRPFMELGSKEDESSNSYWAQVMALGAPHPYVKILDAPKLNEVRLELWRALDTEKPTFEKVTPPDLDLPATVAIYNSPRIIQKILGL